MNVEFFHRHTKRLNDNNVRALIADDLAKTGYVPDRLYDVKARRYGRSYWRYLVPLRRVTA
jgi:hypothetical protein